MDSMACGSTSYSAATASKYSTHSGSSQLLGLPLLGLPLLRRRCIAVPARRQRDLPTAVAQAAGTPTGYAAMTR